MSLRLKIVLTCLAAVFLPLSVLTHYAVRYFDSFTRTALEQEMIHSAYVIGEEFRLAASALLPPSALEENLGKYSAEFQADLHLLSPQGRVLHSSPGAPPPGADLSPWPEIQKAMGGKYGARTALTPNRKFVYYHVALPIQGEEGLLGIAYVVRHTSPIILAISNLRSNFRWIMAVALSLAAGLSILLASTITRRLRRLQDSAQAYARGEPPRPPSAAGNDEIAALEKSFLQMAGEIDRKNTTSREFYAATAHELKTPLTAILGATEVLEQGGAEKPEVRARFLGNIRFEAERLIRLVAQLSELVRLDTEVLRGKKEKTDYPACLREILGRLECAFGPRHAVLRLELPEEPLPVLLVPERIEQVLANLLENAFRYTPVDGTVTLSVRREGDRVLTLLRDTGPGIAPSNLPRVFDRFFSTEPHSPTRPYGSGLGLSIARSIIENHGGTLWVESQPGQGACFSFHLPIAGNL